MESGTRARIYHDPQRPRSRHCEKCCSVPKACIDDDILKPAKAGYQSRSNGIVGSISTHRSVCGSGSYAVKRKTRESGLSDLKTRRCKPCEGGVEPLAPERVRVLLPQVQGWMLSDNGKSIGRSLQFKGFFRTMSFINAMAWIANQQGHHPDFDAGFNYCNVHFTTHAIGGLSENDFICAARLNALLDDET
jgi:4a-hydroxytetrahydrobiopterin dehydratase